MAYGYRRRGFGGRRRFKKSYRGRMGMKGRRRFGRKMKVNGGMRLVPSASFRSGGNYPSGQSAGHELKYLDSSLYNVVAGGGAAWNNASQARVYNALVGSSPNPSGTNTNGVVAIFQNDIDQQGICLNNISSGTDACQRLGRKTNIRSFMLRVTAFLPATSSTDQTPVGASQTVRVVVVLDKQANGSTPVASDVFFDPSHNSTGLGTAITSSSSMMQLNNRDRFLVLADEKALLSPWGKSTHTFEIRRNINIETVYGQISPPSNTQASEIASGSLWVFFLGDESRNAGGTANAEAAQAQAAAARIRYYDA